MSITVAGLGPTDLKDFDKSILNDKFKIFARTRFHNAIEELSKEYEILSFDYIYESLDSTLEVEEEIARILVEKSKTDDILYLVPGSPFSFEKSVEILLKNTKIDLINNKSTLDLILEKLEYVSFGIDIINSKDFFRYNIDFNKDLLIYEVDNEYILEEIIIDLSEIMDPSTRFSIIKDAGLDTEEIYTDYLSNYHRVISPNHQTSLFIYKNEDNKGDFSSLLETTSILRSPDGCPWDNIQDYESLKSHLLEETYEAISAIEKEDFENLKEELGDILYLICLYSEIASELGDFNIFDLINDVNIKLISRHPNVFRNNLDKNENILENYDNIKYSKKGINSYTDRLKSFENMPSVMWAYDIIDKTKKIDFYFDDEKEIIAKIDEEYKEVLDALNDRTRLQEELGDLIFSIIILLYYYDLDPEITIKKANVKFIKRFKKMEEIANLSVIEFQKLGKVRLNELWNHSKNI